MSAIRMNDLAALAMDERDLKELADRIEAEKAKQAKIEALFPAGYAALTSTERLKAVSRAYQENPGLRREIRWIESDEDSALVAPKTAKAVPLAPPQGRRRIRLEG